MEQKFYICKHCGNIVEFLKSSGVSVKCCGEDMTELVANSSDGAKEKHVPVIEAKDGVLTVSVGSTLHPMLEEHHIEWIYVKTNKGSHKINLVVGEKPQADFILPADEQVLEVYEYCNLHGLWVSKA